MKYVVMGIGATVLLLLLIFGGCTWGTYNGLVSSRNNVDKSWGDVEASYQRRLDTIPKFVETAKFSVEFQLKLAIEYAKQRENLDRAAQTRDPAALESAAENGLTALVVAVRAEAVPEAKTDQLTELNAEVENVERVINHERKAYNDACRGFRNKVQTFPGNLVAGLFGFSASYCDYFEAKSGADESPPVSFD